MKNPNTDALKFKSMYLLKISEKAKDLSAIVEEIYDAKHWVDMCQEDLAATIEQDASENPCHEQVEDAKRRFNRANNSLKECLNSFGPIEAELRNFKDEVECLGTEVNKFTKD